jgi:hypothetical protein
MNLTTLSGRYFRQVYTGAGEVPLMGGGRKKAVTLIIKRA